MKIIAFDRKSDNEWYKQWSTLGCEIDIYNCTLRDERSLAMEVIKGCQDNNNKVIILIHKDHCLNQISSLLNKLKCDEFQPKPFIMYVHTPGCSASDQEELPWWTHACQRPFPSGQDLSYLREDFKHLCEMLEAAEGKNETKEAYEVFDSNVIGEFLSLVSPWVISNDIRSGELDNQILNKGESWKNWVIRYLEHKMVDQNVDELVKLMSALRTNGVGDWLKYNTKFLHVLARRFL